LVQNGLLNMKEPDKADANASANPDDSDNAVLARVVAEIGDRLERGEPVDQETYLRQYPELAERLRSLWPVLVATAEIGDTASPRAVSLERPSATVDDPTDEKDAGRLGDFRVLREIGRGGMGIVYEAFQTSLRRRVALKVLTAAGAMDRRQIQRFQVEALAAATLHHPNIVTVHSVGCERGVHYYAMGLIEGRSLADFIAELREIDGLDPVEPSRVRRSSAGSTLEWILQRIEHVGDAAGDGASSEPEQQPPRPSPALRAPSPRRGEGQRR
jgi:serine/threonine-protein kinase